MRHYCHRKLMEKNQPIPFIILQRDIARDEPALSLHRHSTFSYCYRPQRSCGQGYVFTRVCDSVHRGGLPQCMLGYQPPWEQTPESRHPPGADPTPTPWEQTPPWEADIPQSRPP